MARPPEPLTLKAAIVEEGGETKEWALDLTWTSSDSQTMFRVKKASSIALGTWRSLARGDKGDIEEGHDLLIFLGETAAVRMNDDYYTFLESGADAWVYVKVPATLVKAALSATIDAAVGRGLRFSSIEDEPELEAASSPA